MKRTHLVIPDVQAKDGCDYSYLSLIGKFICDKKPDVIVQIGDFADLPSLSSYDVGKKSFEGRRYKRDIEVAQLAMQTLCIPIFDMQAKQKVWKEKIYRPEMYLTLGNHEERINRVVESDPKLDGTISISDLGYESFGWQVSDFLQPVVVDSVCYSHYFTTGVLGRPVTSARQLIQKKHMSCVMGHHQLWDMHRDTRADGSAIIGLMVGACYTHNEDYLGPQGNNYSRQIWVLHEVENGDFQPMMVSLDYLKKRYGQ